MIETWQVENPLIAIQQNNSDSTDMLAKQIIDGLKRSSPYQAYEKNGDVTTIKELEDVTKRVMKICRGEPATKDLAGIQHSQPQALGTKISRLFKRNG